MLARTSIDPGTPSGSMPSTYVETPREVRMDGQRLDNATSLYGSYPDQQGPGWHRVFTHDIYRRQVTSTFRHPPELNTALTGTWRLARHNRAALRRETTPARSPRSVDSYNKAKEARVLLSVQPIAAPPSRLNAGTSGRLRKRQDSRGIPRTISSCLARAGSAGWLAGRWGGLWMLERGAFGVLGSMGAVCSRYCLVERPAQENRTRLVAHRFRCVRDTCAAARVRRRHKAASTLAMATARTLGLDPPLQLRPG